MTAERLYKTAHDAMLEGNYNRAIKVFEQLESRFPYGRYAQQAILESAYANYRTGETPALDAIPALYFTDAIGGRDRNGVKIPRDFAVDVGAAFEFKQAMLAQHESQAAWVARQHGIADHLADMDAWTRRVGRDFGVELAEGFRQYRHTPYPKTPVLQDLLGDAVIAAP